VEMEVITPQHFLVAEEADAYSQVLEELADF
jgi:hypothetical protein